MIFNKYIQMKNLYGYEYVRAGKWWAAKMHKVVQ